MDYGQIEAPPSGSSELFLTDCGGDDDNGSGRFLHIAPHLKVENGTVNTACDHGTISNDRESSGSLRSEI